MSVSARLKELNIELPKVAPPVAAYVPAVRMGNLVQTSGQLPVRDGELVATGAASDASDLALLQEAARQCALNAIAAGAEEAGGVDKLGRVVKVTGFVASEPGYNGAASVINGASELLQDVFGSAHARSAIGLVSLPMGASVEVEVLFELA